MTEEGRKAKKAGGYKLYEQIKEQNKNTAINTQHIGVNHGVAAQGSELSDFVSLPTINPTNQTTENKNKFKTKALLNWIVKNIWFIIISIVIIILAAIIQVKFKLPH